MIVCVLYPRFELLAAVGDRRAMLSEPVALAPEAGREQVVGEVSAAAEAFGVSPGMRVGEALARCPELRLAPPDPEGVRALWRKVLDRLEGIGAAVESDRPGCAFFAADGLHGIHGGHLEGVLAATRRALGRGIRLGAGPSRFSSYAAARRARPRRAEIVAAGGVRPWLAPLPVSFLRARPELGVVADTLERLGIRTLGELSSLPPPAVAERFGHPGLLALDLARGRDTPLELLVARVLARPERRGRSLRSAALSARFVAGGTWRTRVTLREASADAGRLRTVLAPKLAELPAPADSLALEVEAFGPPAHHQGRLVEERDSTRRMRLNEAVRQARQAAGDDAAMRVLEVDPDSRLPERRALLAPWTDA